MDLVISELVKRYMAKLQAYGFENVDKEEILDFTLRIICDGKKISIPENVMEKIKKYALDKITKFEFVTNLGQCPMGFDLGGISVSDSSMTSRVIDLENDQIAVDLKDNKYGRDKNGDMDYLERNVVIEKTDFYLNEPSNGYLEYDKRQPISSRVHFYYQNTIILGNMLLNFSHGKFTDGYFITPTDKSVKFEDLMTGNFTYYMFEKSINPTLGQRVLKQIHVDNKDIYIEGTSINDPRIINRVQFEKRDRSR